MKLSFAAIVGALAAIASAKPAFTNTVFDVQEGSPFTLNWVNATGPVTLVLMSGPSSGTLTPFKTISSGVTGTSFTYTPSGLPSGNYAFQITDATSINDPNYSVLFPYVGTGTASSSSVSSVTKSASVTSATTGSSSITTAESSTTRGTTTSTKTTATTTPRPTTTTTNNNNAQRFSSPLALVVITVAALVFFN